MYITEIFIFVGGLHRLYDSRNEVSLSFRLSFKHAHWDISRDGGKINSVQSVEASYDFRKHRRQARVVRSRGVHTDFFGRRGIY